MHEPHLSSVRTITHFHRDDVVIYVTPPGAGTLCFHLKSEYINFLPAHRDWSGLFPTEGFLGEQTTPLATAPRALGYQDLTNADQLLNQNKACF